MNQEHIGKFISHERKKHNLTQKELAERLSISEKTISKWECGKGLPEVSLMKPLCKELNITVTELLNGCRDPKNEETKEEGIINYIDYTKKKSTHKLILLSIISLLLITFILSTVCYFFNTYNKIAVYELSGSNENFQITDLYVTKSNIYNILYTGQIHLNNLELKKEDILYAELKCENTIIYGRSDFENITYKERYGYDNLFNDYKLKNMDKWNLQITYKENGEKKVDTIPLSNKILMRNNEFISKKIKPIGDSKDNTNPEEVIDPIKERNEKRMAILSDNGYKKIDVDEVFAMYATYEKELNNQESITINLTGSYYPDIMYLYTIKDDQIIRVEDRIRKDNLNKNIIGYIDTQNSSYPFEYNIETKELTYDTANNEEHLEIKNINEIMKNYNNYRQELYNLLNKPFEENTN